MSAPQRLIMDAVNAFNMELFSMIDMKPPISRAKMMSVTKSAIKAIKLYKHVVQIVEKFIKKCKPELKVPGLYVVDSIIRQSRHQFGVDKDVFAPRFLKNFTDTFQNLYLCPVDDKSKIVRVLNLWQKNGVFDMDIIQPLLDMATGPFVPGSTHGGVAATQAETHPPVTSASVVSPLPQLHNSDALAAVAQLFQSSQGQELQKLLQNFQQGDMPQAPMMANTIPAHLQMTATAQLNPHSTQPTEHKSSLAKKLLDRFDYDDEPEDVKKYEMNSTAPPHLGVPGNMYTQFVGQMPNMEHFQPQVMGNTNAAGNQLYGGLMLGGMQQLAGVSQMVTGGYPPLNEAYAQQTAQQSQGNSREDSSMRRDGKPRGHGRKSRSRSGSRSPRRRMSRSTSGSLRSRQRRSHSRSREQRLNSPRSRSQERKEREKDREHRQKGLPSIKSQTLSVCSTTLWVGQLDKRTQQQDVTSLLEEFGQIESINMIPPRGCAYIVMVHRQDAYKALQKLSKGSFKVNQKAIKIAWALNKGIKAAHKKFWDVERGVTYIPWSKVKVEELESCRQGGMLDMETLNPVWNGTVKNQNKAGVNNAPLESIKSEGSVTAHVQVPPVLPAGSIGGPSAFPGSMVLPPPSIPPGGPPPPFLPTGFDHTKMPPGFPPPVVGAGNTTEEAAKDPAGGIGAPSDVGSDNLLGSPGGPMMSPQGPTGLLGHRPGMQPFHPPGLPPPHLQPFLPPPNMPPMLPQMMPRSPNRMFPPGRFRMPMSHPPMADFPPHGPPFPLGPSMGPKEDDWEERRFRNDGPGFGREQDRFGERPPYQRGGGGNGWSRDAAEGRDHFMNRHDR